MTINFPNVYAIKWILQELLEKSNVPFVGTQSNDCRKAFDKVTLFPSNLRIFSQQS